VRPVLYAWQSRVESAPDACEKVWWGKRLEAVGVDLGRSDRAFLRELLTDAWENKAPKRVRHSYERLRSITGSS
jgi:hypothetical protein